MDCVTARSSVGIGLETIRSVVQDTPRPSSVRQVSSENPLNQMPVNIGEAEVAALEAVREALVVDA